MIKEAVASMVLLFSSSAPVAAQPSVEYPKNYRQWTHVKTLILQTGHPLYEAFGGIHHIYANSQALRGYREGRFPEGSVLVFDLLEAVEGKGQIAEGERKVLAVMQKESARFPKTGGWGFEAFVAGDPERPSVGESAASACFACHSERRDHDYVFSSYRD